MTVQGIQESKHLLNNAADLQLSEDLSLSNFYIEAIAEKADRKAG